jgi:redox-sensitive bicupin YhaK (pirin superfamily)
LAGSGTICDSPAAPEQALVLGPGDHISATAAHDSSKGLKFLLIAGRPIKEPIVQHGPFVMNTQEEIMQAFMDYQSGKLQNPDDNPWVDDEL